MVPDRGAPRGDEGRTEPELIVTAPRGADELGFLLVVGDERGLREATISIPIVTSPGAVPLTTGRDESSRAELMADAGDDQIGLVGRRITLNASGSSPSTGLGYRWIQVAGPATESTVESGKFLSFTPKVEGRYRFALVVAHDSRISAVDYVTVDVGILPGTTATNPIVSGAMVPGSDGARLDAIVSAAMALVDEAPTLAGALADAFEGSAFRLELYGTYSELYAEPLPPAGRNHPQGPRLSHPLERGLLRAADAQHHYSAPAAGPRPEDLQRLRQPSDGTPEAGTQKTVRSRCEDAEIDSRDAMSGPRVTIPRCVIQSSIGKRRSDNESSPENDSQGCDQCGCAGR